MVMEKVSPRYDAISNPSDQPMPSQPRTVTIFGLNVLGSLGYDARLLFLSKLVRMFSYGFLAVMLVIYMQEIGYTDDSIGLMFTLTLLGDAVISILLTSHADRVGRRLTLLLGSLLAIATSFVFATQSNFYVLLAMGVIGVISPSGSEMGPFMAIELSSLSQVTNDSDRTSIMAWYNLVGSFASAGGALVCGFLLNIFQNPSYGGNSLKDSCRQVLFIYALVQVVQLICFFQLSPAIEVPTPTGSSPSGISSFLGLHKSKGIVMQLSLLFMLDSFAGSFVLQSIISAWFFSVYKTPTVTLGSIVFYCNVIAGISALFAAEIARAIGLVMTMVVTHLPSNILLILVPLMPSETAAIAMLAARYSISQMDVPTRNAYVQSVVDADERSAANGVTNVIRSIGASTGPYLSGLLTASVTYRNYPFYIAGALKIVYDLLLLYNFQNGQQAVNAVSSAPKQDAKLRIGSKEEHIELLGKNNV